MKRRLAISMGILISIMLTGCASYHKDKKTTENTPKTFRQVANSGKQTIWYSDNVNEDDDTGKLSIDYAPSIVAVKDGKATNYGSYSSLTFKKLSKMSDAEIIKTAKIEGEKQALHEAKEYEGEDISDLVGIATGVYRPKAEKIKYIGKMDSNGNYIKNVYFSLHSPEQTISEHGKEFKLEESNDLTANYGYSVFNGKVYTGFTDNGKFAFVTRVPSKNVKFTPDLKKHKDITIEQS